MLKGARQVGKTETVRHFAETAYTDYIEINFVERPEFKEIVRDSSSVDSLISNISIIDQYKGIRWGVKLVNGNVGFANGILTLPQWCTFKLPEIIRDFRKEATC